MSRPRKKKIENPFADWPSTKFLPKEGAYHVTGKYKFDAMGGGALLLVLVGVGIVIAAWPAGIVYFIILIGLGMKATDRKINVKLSQEVIEINGKAYGRGEGLNQFGIEEHEKAYSEERQGASKSRIYRESLQVVMWYGEIRVPIAEFKKNDKRKAQALLVRLQLLNGGLEKMLAAEIGKDGTEPGGDDFGKPREIR